MIVFGRQCFMYVLQNSPKSMQEIYLSKEIDKKLFRQISNLNIPILRIDNKKAQSLAHGRNHQGMFAKINNIDLAPINKVLESKNIIVLCGLSDVGNIGSIVRTSYALGIEGIILCDRSMSDESMEGVFRSSSGALLNMPLCVVESSLEFINNLKMKNFKLIAGGRKEDSKIKDFESLESILDSKNKMALFLGSENDGLKNKLLQKMDCMIHINMQHDFDSLNVSVAAGILIDRIFNRT